MMQVSSPARQDPPPSLLPSLPPPQFDFPQPSVTANMSSTKAGLLEAMQKYTFCANSNVAGCRPPAPPPVKVDLSVAPFAEGGFGKVYLAEDESGKPAAVKVRTTDMHAISLGVYV